MDKEIPIVGRSAITCHFSWDMSFDVYFEEYDMNYMNRSHPP